MRSAAALLLVASGAWAGPSTLGNKKLLEYGWDTPSPAYARTHAAEMEARPFDGVVLRLESSGSIFRHAPLDAAKVEAEGLVLRAVPWTRFKDNFAIFWAAADPGWDWLDEADWAAAIKSTTSLARAARVGKLRGLCFDPEPYGLSPWRYDRQPASKTLTYPELAAKVRLRGRAFAGALQQEYPGLVLFMFFHLSVLEGALRVDGPARAARLQENDFGLLLPFLEGMLAVAKPGFRIVEGDEWLYHADSSERFFRSYHAARSRAPDLIRPELREAYARQVEVAQPIYLDELIGLRTDKPELVSRRLSPADQLRFLQHNVYWALYTADEYAWLYSEKFDWWKKPVPPAIDAVVREAAAFVRRDRDLGFRIEPAIERALTLPVPPLEKP